MPPHSDLKNSCKNSDNCTRAQQHPIAETSAHDPFLRGGLVPVTTLSHSLCLSGWRLTWCPPSLQAENLLEKSCISAGPTVSTAHFGCEDLLRGEVGEFLSSSLPEVYCISSLGCHNKILQAVWLNPQGFIFLQLWSPGSAKSRSDKVWSPARAFFLVCRQSPSWLLRHTATLGVRASTYEFWGEQNSVHISHLPENECFGKIPLFGEHDCSHLLVSVGTCDSWNARQLQKRQCGSRVTN